MAAIPTVDLGNCFGTRMMPPDVRKGEATLDPYSNYDADEMNDLMPRRCKISDPHAA
ncbi:MAG: hypothetical protein ACYCV7_17580 [Acidimicrobiales bacterium]